MMTHHSRHAQEANVDDAVDALIAESDEDRVKRERLLDLIANQEIGIG